MKRIIFVLFTVTALSCTESSKNIKVKKTDTSAKEVNNEVEKIKGFYSIDIEILKDYKDSIKMVDNSGKTKFLLSDNLSIEGNQVSWYIEPEDSLRSLISIYALYPEYNICVFEAEKKAGKIKVKINNKFYSTTLGSSSKFETIEQHLRNNIIVIRKDGKLFKEKDGAEHLVERVNDYSFKALSFEGDWMKVKCFNDCEGCLDNDDLVGWVKFIEGDKLLVDVYYTC